jgi:dihydroxyacetone kinase
MGIALSPCIVPAAGHTTFELPPGHMEIGMGIHGEPGVRQGPLESADAVTDPKLALKAHLHAPVHSHLRKCPVQERCSPRSVSGVPGME